MRPSSGRLPLTNKVDDNSKSVGILYTGYLEKRNPVSGAYKKRFVVLTHEAIHWFDRQEDEDLFGEERGRIKLNVVISVRVLDEDGNSFQIESIDKSKRIFRSTSPTTCEEWVSALKSTIKNLGEYTKKKAALHAQHQNDNHFSRYNNSYDNNEEDDATPDVNVLLVSHVTTYSPYGNNSLTTSSANSVNNNINTTEIVLARNPEWDRLIFLPNVLPNDKLLISLSNGGLVTLSYHLIEVYSEGGVDFEVAVQNVTLASSLRMTVQNINNINSESKSGNNNMKKSMATGKTNSSSSSFFSSSSSSLSFLFQINQHILALCCNRSTLVPFILSIMVLFVSALSFRHFQPNVSLFVMFSIVNALYVIMMLSSQTRGGDGRGAGNQQGSYNVRIHAHSFTSPDAPINTPEDDIPKRFIDGCEGDMKEARRRWDITRHWRETERLDDILTEPQPHFFTIKAMLPHYHFGRDRTGHVVYYERPGLAKLDEMKARGVGPDEMYRHWLFFVEYQYRVLLNDDETAKTVAVLDMDQVNMSFMSGDTFVHLKRTIAAANAHYPERSHVIYVVNAPYIASMLWGMVKGMVHPNTQKKVRILTKAQTLKGLQEHIAIEDIPEYYGGMAKCNPPVEESDSGSTPPAAVEDSCRYYGPDTVAMGAYVRKINAQGASASQDPFDVISDKRASVASAAAMGANATSASSSSNSGSGNNKSNGGTANSSVANSSNRSSGSNSNTNAKNPPGQQGVLNALKDSVSHSIDSHNSNGSSNNNNNNNQLPHNTVTGAATYTNQYPSFGNQPQQQQRLPPVSESNKKNTSMNTANKSTPTSNNRLFAFNKAVRQQDTWSVNSDTFSTP